MRMNVGVVIEQKLDHTHIATSGCHCKRRNPPVHEAPWLVYAYAGRQQRFHCTDRTPDHTLLPEFGL
jgi:hypothetical protein